MIQDIPKMLTRDEALAIPDEMCPLLVLTDRRGFIPWAIERLTGKGRETGHYNHAGALYRQGVVAEQCWRFQRTPLKNYLDGKYRVKFWCWNPGWTDADRTAMDIELQTLLRMRGKYDWPGVLGQLWAAVFRTPGLREMNCERRNYCSEAMVQVFRLADKFLFCDNHASPADLDRACKAHPKMRAMVFDPRL